MRHVFARLICLLLVVFLLPISMASGGGADTRAIHGSDNRDTLTNNVLHTIPLADAVRDHLTGRDGEYLAKRVISTVSPVVVRQNDPKGPKYQEGIGYSFLLNAPKYPGLTKLGDGTLVLTLTAALSGGPAFGSDKGRTDVILFSKDDGLSWSQPRRVPGYRTTPMSLGGNRLMLRGWVSHIDYFRNFRFWFSDDGGKTWSEPEKVPPLPDGREVNTDVAPTMLIEGDTVRFLFYAKGLDGRFRTETVIRPYNHVKHEWQDPIFFDSEWTKQARSSEASITRAKNGDLVASFRSHRAGIPSPSDLWRSIVTSRSTDDGKTWSKPDIHSLYGHVHHSLLTFPDGRILMTYAARLGELDGRLYHGHEAVFSHDHGKTWDWERRYILFRGIVGAMHSPQSVVLSNGKVLTVVMHPISYSWKDKDTQGNITALSNVSIVIWKP